MSLIYFEGGNFTKEIPVENTSRKMFFESIRKNKFPWKFLNVAEIKFPWKFFSLGYWNKFGKICLLYQWIELRCIFNKLYYVHDNYSFIFLLRFFCHGCKAAWTITVTNCFCFLLTSFHSRNFWKTEAKRFTTPSWSLTCSKLTIETPEQGVKYVQS